MNAKYLFDTDIIKSQLSRKFITVNLSKMDFKVLNKLTVYKLSQTGKNSFMPKKHKYMKEIKKFLIYQKKL